MSPAAKVRPSHLRPVEGPSERALEEQAIFDAWENESKQFGVLLYDHLHGVVDRTIYRVLGRRTDEHDDLVQVTFEKLLISLSKGSFERECSLRSWAAMIATRTALNSIRARSTARRFFVSDEGGAEPAGRHPVPVAESRQLLEHVRREIAKLPEVGAEVLLLHDVLGHELSEISALVGLSVSAAQSRLVRSRRDLHRRLIEAGVVSPLGEPPESEKS